MERADALMSTLNEEMEFVGYYVNIEAQQMGDNFSYTTHVAPDVDADRVRLPAMVIQIFAENAIKHGLRPLKADSPRLLDISVTREQGQRSGTHRRQRGRAYRHEGGAPDHTDTQRPQPREDYLRRDQLQGRQRHVGLPLMDNGAR